MRTRIDEPSLSGTCVSVSAYGSVLGSGFLAFCAARTPARYSRIWKIFVSLLQEPRDGDPDLRI
jgi:hypothetical protein